MGFRIKLVGYGKFFSLTIIRVLLEVLFHILYYFGEQDIDPSGKEQVKKVPQINTVKKMFNVDCELITTSRLKGTLM